MAALERNSTNFPLQVTAALAPNDSDTAFLKRNQAIARRYVSTGVRGLIAVHGMGMGKSLLAAAVAFDMVKTRPIVVLSSKGLHDNMRRAVRQYAKLSGDVRSEYELTSWIQKSFTFATLGSSNMISQLRPATDTIGLPVTVSDSLLIIDEAHNLFRAIVNGSKNAYQLYETVMESPNIKLLFLTGTPIANDPFELVPCFNMLSGSRTTLPEDYKLFDNLYVSDGSAGSLKNKAYFQNRVTGLVSYASAIVDDGSMPTLKPLIVEKCEMKGAQLAKYSVARAIEIDSEATWGRRGPAGAACTKTKSEKTSTYRVKTRQMSNFVDSESASPKFVRMLANISGRHHGQQGLVYSQFVSEGGLGSFVKFLNQAGWKEHDATGANDATGTNDATGANDTDGTYSLITGAVTPEERTAIQASFNDHHQPTILLVSATGAEGLDLKCIRHVHIMEPYWNWGRVKQVIARGVRRGSHTSLPENERDVTPYIYLATVPDGPSTDTELYEKSLVNRDTIDSFITALKEASIDCTLNGYTGCRVCAPTSRPLFTSDPLSDTQRPDPCECTDAVRREVSAQKVILDGVTPLYVGPEDKSLALGRRVYRYDAGIAKWVPLLDLDPLAKRAIDEMVSPSFKSE